MTAIALGIAPFLFIMALTLVGLWSWRHPFGSNGLQSVVKRKEISRHYGVAIDHGSVPCQPLLQAQSAMKCQMSS